MPSFHWPWALLLLLALPMPVYMMLRRPRQATVRFASLVDMRHCGVSWRSRLRVLLVAGRVLCLGLLVAGLARPRKGIELSQISTEGVAIEAVVDRSGSMRAEMDYAGLKLNRLEVVKRVLTDFVKGDKRGLPGRTSDLIGLVTFARYADTVCPLVLSHNVLTEFLDKTEIVRVQNEDGTAIGDAIALAAARLRKAEEEIQRRNVRLGFAGQGQGGQRDPSFTIKSKAIILLTDGRNNTGDYSPLEAAELAKKWGIKIYTIGIGSAQSYMKVQGLLRELLIPTGDDLDEELLKDIATQTGGFYRRADDADALRAIVGEIDKMEKSEVKSDPYVRYAERFGWFAWPALCVLAFEILAGCTFLRKVP